MDQVYKLDGQARGAGRTGSGTPLLPREAFASRAAAFVLLASSVAGSGTPTDCGKTNLLATNKPATKQLREYTHQRSLVPCLMFHGIAQDNPYLLPHGTLQRVVCHLA